MSRIRSLHPGQWTDEDFVTCSPMARLLALALRNECDDQGVFEWKPVTIKMRLLPADDVDVSALLSELVENRQIAAFDHDGKRYGAVRNFRKYQRPKKPTDTYHLPPEWRTYVGLNDDGSSTGSEPVGNHSPTPSEKSPQMEEVGGREGGSNPPNPPSGGDGRSALTKGQRAEFEAWYAGYPHKVQRGAAEKAWPKARAKASLEEIRAGTARYVAAKPADHNWRNPATFLNGEGWRDEPAAPDERPADPAQPVKPRRPDVQFAWTGEPADLSSLRSRLRSETGSAWPVYLDRIVPDRAISTFGPMPPDDVMAKLRERAEHYGVTVEVGDVLDVPVYLRRGQQPMGGAAA